MANKNTAQTAPKTNPDDKALLDLLKGLSTTARAAITNQVRNIVEKEQRQEAELVKLEAARAKITEALKGIEVENFDVHKRGSTIEVKLVGITTAGRTLSSPKATPIRDSGMTMEQLVQTYLPEKMGEFAEGDGNRKYALANQALKVKGAQAAKA